MMKVKVTQETSWKRALNAARRTIGKEPLDKEPSDNWKAMVIMAEHSPIQIACGYIVKNDLTLSPCYVAKVGNSFAHGNTLKEAVADAEAKELMVEKSLGKLSNLIKERRKSYEDRRMGSERSD